MNLNELRKKYAIKTKVSSEPDKPNVISSNYNYVAHVLQHPVIDGRHRLLWLVLAPYLVNILQLPEDIAIDMLQTYLTQCEQLYNTDATTKVEYYVRYAKNTGLKPLKLETLKEKYPDLYNIVIDALN